MAPPCSDPEASYRFAFAEGGVESSTALEPCSGTVPVDLQGSLYRNGPGRSDAFHGYGGGHPFERYGMVCRFAFAHGQVHFRNRVVRTNAYVEEERARRRLYRTAAANLRGGLAANLLRTRFRDTANTSVVRHGDALLAMAESGGAWELDPDTLETRGKYRPLSTGFQHLACQSPHAKLDGDTLVAFEVRYVPVPTLVLIECERDGTSRRTHVPLSGATLLHDFALTPTHALFVLHPWQVELAPMVLGLKTPLQSVQTTQGPTQIVAVERATGRVQRWTTPERGFTMHVVDACHDGDTIELRALTSAEPPPLDGLDQVYRGRTEYPATELTSYRLGPRSSQAVMARFPGIVAEFPSLPLDASGAFFALLAEPGRRPRTFHRLARVERDGTVSAAYDFGAHNLPGEPVLLRGSGDTAYVGVVVLRTRHGRAELHVLRANDLSPCCALLLPTHVPPGLHGSWHADAG